MIVIPKLEEWLNCNHSYLSLLHNYPSVWRNPLGKLLIFTALKTSPGCSQSSGSRASCCDTPPPRPPPPPYIGPAAARTADGEATLRRSGAMVWQGHGAWTNALRLDETRMRRPEISGGALPLDGGVFHKPLQSILTHDPSLYHVGFKSALENTNTAMTSGIKQYDM